MKEINAFRKGQYLGRELDYLCGDAIEKIERKYRCDERSQHFWVEFNSQIVGTLRVKPYPFELMAIGEYFNEIGCVYQRHVEFGRLVIDSDRNTRVSVHKLMASAFLYSLQNGYSGIVAISRTPQKRLFERFGLFSLNRTAVILSERKGGAYWVLEGDCESISRAVVDRIKQELTQ